MNNEKQANEIVTKCATWGSAKYAITEALNNAGAREREKAINDCIAALTERHLLTGAPMLAAIACLKELLVDTKEDTKCKHEWSEVVGICTKCGIPMSTGRC